ncbi:PREDICTED: icarapin-like [Ceratosolen solmsi marchali]|uniref:Icarapin-like n=1 Tax=Ceratosolen solmsi marchali TaxID=326594 RepID=A0AAJ6YN26_9HYME|nr:PREDICTED: icarapin-like [Ceratosolen solmsi marchali]
MRSFHVLFLLSSCIALAHTFPGANRDSIESMEIKDKDDGVVLVVPVRKNIFDEQTDEEKPLTTSLWRPFRFDSSPFDGLMIRMQMAINKIRAEMAAALASQLRHSNLTPWGKIPEGANSTSTTKVIGEHAVTINETTYSNGNDDAATIFRVRVVEVKPLNETVESTSVEETGTKFPTMEQEEHEELTTPVLHSVETVEDIDNEIPKIQVDTLSA